MLAFKSVEWLNAVGGIGFATVTDVVPKANPRVTIVFPSSRLVYGKPRYLLVDERHPLAPESIYAADKLAVENYLLIFGMLYGMKVTVLRISNPYGPMQPKRTHGYGIANKFIQAAVAGWSRHQFQGFHQGTILCTPSETVYRVKNPRASPLFQMQRRADEK